MKETVQWTTPSPLWETAISQTSAVLRRTELNRPSILRFATDTFMDDFMQMLASDPKRLNQYVALPETWRGVAPSPQTLKPAPAFARNMERLGLIAKRKKDKSNGLSLLPEEFTEFSEAKIEEKLKLYQPAHQRFYLISACLVCERPGLPDKTLTSDREEKVSFVIRRLFPPDELDIDVELPPLNSSWQEYAFVITPQGEKWQKVDTKSPLVENEERQTLFAVGFDEDDGRRRKIFSGVIPAARREAFMAAGNAAAAGDDDLPDSRTIVMNSQFRDPWKSLLQTAWHAKKAITETYIENGVVKNQPDAVKANLAKTSREQIQTMSWLALLDFADFLEKNVLRVWNKLNGATVSPGSKDAQEDALVQAITNTKFNSVFNTDVELPATQSIFLKDTNYTKDKVKRSLKDALLSVRGTNPETDNPISKDLEAVSVSYDRKTPNEQYPDFLFPLADPVFNLQMVLPKEDGSGVETVQITPTDFTVINSPNPPLQGEDYVNRFARLVKAALPDAPTNLPPQPIPLAAQTPMDMREGWFVIRCVYERPLCGAIDPPVLSEPTKPFQIAGFFDPDAPARPIRISLPIDPTPAGLRKFDKNAVFMMSDLLCGQVNRMKGITFGDLIRSVLPFPLHKDLSVPDGGSCKKAGTDISIGMMCSLSIPIITICALILLMIIVSLLDFIFRWMPFFIMCFPLPGLKAKK